MCNSIILKLEDISSIKRYFEFILSQTEKAKSFPLNLMMFSLLCIVERIRPLEHL